MELCADIDGFSHCFRTILRMHIFLQERGWRLPSIYKKTNKSVCLPLSTEVSLSATSSSLSTSKSRKLRVTPLSLLCLPHGWNESNNDVWVWRQDMEPLLRVLSNLRMGWFVEGQPCFLASGINFLPTWSKGCQRLWWAGSSGRTRSHSQPGIQVRQPQTWQPAYSFQETQSESAAHTRKGKQRRPESPAATNEPCCTSPGVYCTTHLGTSHHCLSQFVKGCSVYLLAKISWHSFSASPCEYTLGNQWLRKFPVILILKMFNLLRNHP